MNTYRELAIEIASFMEKCPECGGKGWGVKGWVILDTEKERCQYCEGTGIDIDELADEIAHLLERRPTPLALDGATAPKVSGDMPADVLAGDCTLPGPPRQ
jgi:RecJ-like exonuclease